LLSLLLEKGGLSYLVLIRVIHGCSLLVVLLTKFVLNVYVYRQLVPVNPQSCETEYRPSPIQSVGGRGLTPRLAPRSFRVVNHCFLRDRHPRSSLWLLIFRWDDRRRPYALAIHVKVSARRDASRWKLYRCLGVSL
jgi:hypothetical protein